MYIIYKRPPEHKQTVCSDEKRTELIQQIEAPKTIKASL